MQFDSLLSPEDCQLIIDKYEASPNKQQGAVNNHGVRQVDKSYKQAMDINISSDPAWKDIDTAIYNVVSATALSYKNKLGESGSFLYICSDEPYVVRKYTTNDFYNRHVDTGSGHTNLRRLAMLIYLNNVIEGGETYFPTLDLSFSPRQGSGLVFPANWMFIHEGKPPTSNPKYIVRIFLNSD